MQDASALVRDPDRPHKAAVAPSQRDRGDASGKAHEIRSEGNNHVPRSFRSFFPVTDDEGRNKASVVAAPTGATRGYEPGKSKELLSRRTAATTTYLNPDGTETTAIAGGPVRYQDDSGTWRDIVPEFVSGSSATWQAAGGGTEIELGGGDLATVTVDAGHSVGWTLAGGRDVRPSIDGDTATYREIARDTDLEIEAQAAAAKETIVLRSSDAPASFDFRLDLDGLSAQLRDGHVLLTDAEGAVHAVIPSGYMTDAAGATSSAVDYRLDGDVLRVSVDGSWLADSGRQFPVRVDPSVLTPKKMKASTAMTVYGGGAYNGASDLEVGGSSNARTYLKWDVSAIANHKIFGANLSVVNYQANSCSPRAVAVHEVVDSWSLTPASYSLANAPSLGRKLDSTDFAYGYVGYGDSSSSCPVQASLFELGVGGRDIVQSWANGGANRGLALTGSGWKKFAGPSTANAPTLYVTHSPYDARYKIANPTPNPIVMQNQNGGVTVTVTNKSAYAWAAGDYSLRYRVFDGKGKPYAALPTFNAATMPALGRGATANVAATIKAMPAGMYYLDFSVVRNSPLTWFTDQQVAPVRLALQIFDIPPVVTQMYPPHGYSAPTLQPQLFGKAIDVDATPNATTYLFKVCTNQAMTVGCFTSGTATTATGWVVPAGKLAWSKQYYWNFKSGTTTSPTLTFFTDAPQPTLTSHLAGTDYGSQEREFDPSLGNYATAAIDAAVATSGPDLTVARTYNSLDPRADGAFGAGWTSKLDVKATSLTNSVQVNLPNGQQIRFGRNPDKTYAAPRGRDLAFVASATDWELSDQSGSTYTFDSANGRLTSIQGATGRPETFTYDATGRLDKILSGNSGRGLKLTWNGNRVGSVVTLDSAGTPVTTWSYTYDGDLLTKVCAPTGSCTTYDYSDGSHYRSAVLDNKPDSYWRLGETGGTRAESEVLVNLGKDAGTYLAGTTYGTPGVVANSADTAVTLTGTQAVRLPNGASKKSRDMTVELWFKASPSTTAMPLAGYQNKTFDGATLPSTGVPLMYIGTDGKLRGQFSDGAIAPVTSPGTVTNGVWHHAVLTSVGATTTLYLDGNKQGQKTSTINHVALTYNQAGAAYATTPGSWPSYGTTSRRYFKGSLDEVAVYSHGLSAAEVRDHFDAVGGTRQLAKVTLPSGKIASEITYDVELDRVAEYTDQNGGTWKLGAPVVAGTSTDMRRTVMVADPADRLYMYEYDALQGYLLRSASPNGNSVRPEDTELCKPPTAADPSFCAPPPDDPDNLQMWDISGSDVRSMEYDVNGRVTAVYNEIGDVVTMKYDTRGNVVERKTCRTLVGSTPSDCSIAYTKYPDATSGYGTLDPRWDKPLETRDARSASATDNTYKTAYTYTPSGQLETQTGPAPENALVRNNYSAGTETAADGDGTIPSGLPLSSTDDTGASTRFTYFKTGDVATITEPGGLVTRYTYDALGRTKSRTELAAGVASTTTFEYDEASRLRRTVMPATTDAITGVEHQQQVVQTYDADGNVVTTEVSDVKGNDQPRVTTYEYDDRNRLSRVVDPLGNEVNYGYDRFGNQTSMVDALGTRTEFAYTAKNKVSEVRLRDPDRNSTPGFLVTTAYAYDAAGRMVMTFDAMGRKVVIDYLRDDLVAKKTLTTFRRPGATQDTPYVLEEYGYDKAGHVVSEKTANGTRVATYTRDEYGRVKTRTTGTGTLTRRETYTYDRVGNITRVDTSGDKTSNVPWAIAGSSSVSYEYDEAGRRTKQIVALPAGAATTTTEYDAHGRVVKVVSPRGNVAGANPADFATTFAYDSIGNRTKVTLPPTLRVEYGTTPALGSGVQEVGYNTYGEPVASKDALGRVAKVEYDQRGQVVKQTAPSYTAPGTTTPIVSSTSFAYDPNGNQVQVTDPRGSVTNLEYDRLGRVTKVDAPSKDNADRAVTTYDYTRTGEVRRVEGPLGTKVEHTYDDLDRRITSTTFDTVPVADTFTTAYTYDDAGSVTSTRSPLGNETKATYDPLGQLLTVTDPTGVGSSFGYDGAGRQVMVKDGLGRTSKKEYDVAGRMTAEAQLTAAGVEGPKQVYDYDVEGNLVSSTPVGGLPTTYQYDAMGRLTKQIEPVTDSTTITTSFGYDLAGNRTRYIDGRGNATWSTYSTFGVESVLEPPTLAHPAVLDRRWQATYDVAGQPVKLTAPGGITRTRTFDAAGRLTTETGAGAEAATAARALTYDKAGRLTSQATPTGVDSYTYNDRGMQVTAAGPSGAAEFGYDRDGNLERRVDASGTAAFGYTNGRLSSMTDAATAARIGFSYDAAGAPEKIDYGSGRVRAFGYDAHGRMSSDVLQNAVPQPVVSTTYEYDNRNHVSRKTTSGVEGAGDNTYTYDAAARLTSWSVAGGATTTYEWDASGNRTKVDAKVSTYDQRNRLISDGTTDYSYSPRGSLRSRTTGTATQAFTFDAFDRMISQGSRTYSYDSMDRITDAAGLPFRYSGLGNDVISDGTSTFGRSLGGGLISESNVSRKRLLLSDQHGDVVAGFDPATTALTSVPDSRTFDPWGKKVATRGANYAVGFQGSWTDTATGEINMKARWYDTGAGAFTSRDSVDYVAGPSVLANRYLYAAGDPITKNDPDGHWPDFVDDAVDKVSSTVSHYASKAWDYTKSAASKVYGYAKSAVSYAYNAAKAGLSYLADKISSAYNWAKDKISDGIDWARQKAAEAAAAAHRAALALTAKTKALIEHAAKYNPVPIIKKAVEPVYAGMKKVVSAVANAPAQIVQATINTVKTTAKAVQAVYDATVKAAGKVVQEVSTALSAAGEWTQNNWKTIASVAAGIAVGAACTALTAGAGTVACAVLGTAVSGALSGALECPPGKSMASCAGKGAIEAVIAPITDTVGCLSDPTVSGCAAAAMSVVPGAAGHAAGKYIDKLRGSCKCFAAGTKISTAKGDKPIEKVEVGDRVWAKDMVTGKKRLRAVKSLHSHVDTRIMKLVIGGKAVKVTTEHPFHTPDQGWVQSGDLKTGDDVSLIDGGSAKVGAITLSSTPTRVYNFEVEGDHNYAVTDLGVLVHNAACDVPSSSPRPADSPHYSVAYDTRLEPSDYPGRSDKSHFSVANRKLDEAFQSDAEFAGAMDAQFPGIVAFVRPGPRGGYARRSPAELGLTWHHNPTPGVMQLIPTAHHAAPGPVQAALHPGGVGGMAIWGGGR